MLDGPDRRTMKMLESVDLKEILRSEGLGLHVLLGTSLFVCFVLALELLTPGWSALLATSFLAGWVVVFDRRYRKRDRLDAVQENAKAGATRGHGPLDGAR